MEGKFVSYLRVSTAKQGLGIDAQRAAVSAYLNGGSWELVAEFEEKESGKRSDNRPELQKALQLCRLTGATLVIAKLDRLSRNVHFLSGLMESGVEFICCDMPQANKFALHVMAALAEQEREMISARTKASLAAIKAKLQNGQEHVSKAGQPVTHLGGFRGSTPRPEASAAVRKAKAQAFADDHGAFIQERRKNGASLAQIAKEMNLAHRQTPRGNGQWTPMTVKRVLDRQA